MAMTGKDQLGIEVMRQKVLSLGGVVACVHDSDRGLGASASDCQADVVKSRGIPAHFPSTVDFRYGPNPKMVVCS